MRRRGGNVGITGLLTAIASVGLAPALAQSGESPAAAIATPVSATTVTVADCSTSDVAVAGRAEGAVGHRWDFEWPELRCAMTFKEYEYQRASYLGWLDGLGVFCTPASQLEAGYTNENNLELCLFRDSQNVVGETVPSLKAARFLIQKIRTDREIPEQGSVSTGSYELRESEAKLRIEDTGSKFNESLAAAEADICTPVETIDSANPMGDRCVLDAYNFPKENRLTDIEEDIVALIKAKNASVPVGRKLAEFLKKEIDDNFPGWQSSPEYLQLKAAIEGAASSGWTPVLLDASAWAIQKADSETTDKAAKFLTKASFVLAVAQLAYNADSGWLADRARDLNLVEVERWLRDSDTVCEVVDKRGDREWRVGRRIDGLDDLRYDCTIGRLANYASRMAEDEFYGVLWLAHQIGADHRRAEIKWEAAERSAKQADDAYTENENRLIAAYRQLQNTTRGRRQAQLQKEIEDLKRRKELLANSRDQARLIWKQAEFDYIETRNKLIEARRLCQPRLVQTLNGQPVRPTMVSCPDLKSSGFERHPVSL